MQTPRPSYQLVGRFRAALNGTRGHRHAPARWLAAVAVVLLSASHAPGQPVQFTIDWWSADAGGGTSTNADGRYTLSGTIGQPDASNPLSGGRYTLVPGFWSIIAAVQTPGAPLLSVVLTPTNSVVISWPAEFSTGWQLQENADLTTTNWTNVAQPPQPVDSRLEVVVFPPTGNRFYRLKQ
jgi:hypothetical protein